MPKLRFSAWMADSSAAALASLQAHAHQLTRLYPSWYSLGPYAQVQRRPDAGAALRAQVQAFAQAHGVELWPLLSASDPAHPSPQAGLLRLLLHDRGARQAHLAQLLLAACPPRRLADPADCRQDQAHQDTEDGDDDEQLHQRKGRIFPTRDHHGWTPPLLRPAAASTAATIETSVPTPAL